MSLLAVLAAVLGATAGSLATSPAATPAHPSREHAPSTTGDAGWLVRWRLPLVAVAALGGWFVVGGPLGPLVGLAAGVFCWRVIARSESPSVRRRRELLERQLPVGVHLLGSCLRSGTSVEGSFEVVAASLPGPFSERLLEIRHRLAFGVDPAEVWRDLAADPQLGPLGRALSRAAGSGAAPAEAVTTLAAALQDERRTRTEARARAVEVKASAPLGACFLPAFVLLGVIPLVVGIFSTIQLFR